jgi:hypothetical protein
VFSIGTPQEYICSQVVIRKPVARVESGSNTSTVALRVVGGGEKETLESETVKYGHESHGTRTPDGLRWRGKGGRGGP